MMFSLVSVGTLKRESDVISCLIQALLSCWGNILSSSSRRQFPKLCSSGLNQVPSKLFPLNMTHHTTILVHYSAGGWEGVSRCFGNKHQAVSSSGEPTLASHSAVSDSRTYDGASTSTSWEVMFMLCGDAITTDFYS